MSIKHFLTKHEVGLEYKPGGLDEFKRRTARETEKDKKPQKSVWERRMGSWHRHQHITGPMRKIEFIKKYGNLHGNSRVLSVGSGAGRIEIYLAKNVLPAGSITAIEYTASGNNAAKETAEKENVQNALFMRGDAKKLAVPNDSINVVVSLHSLGAIGEKWKDALREMKRVLRQDAESRLIITNLKGVNIDELELRKELSVLGFEIIAEKTMLPLEEGRPESIFLAAKPRTKQ